MAINPALLVSADVLQNYIVDKVTGRPLAGGLIYLYKDSNHQMLKNWYYQTGEPGAYTYNTLPNPLRLSATGTIVDINGYQVIPLYYPFSEQDATVSEKYYIRVYNCQNGFQWDVYGFPQTVGSTAPSPSVVSRAENYIINNNFWNNAGANGTNANQQINLSSQTSYTVAPSNHDGFSMPDWLFQKENTTATEYCSFLKFPAGTSPLNDFNNGLVTPEYYLNHQCTSAGTETVRIYQVPLWLHLDNMQNQMVTFSFCAQNNSSTAASLKFKSYQFLGSTDTPQTNPSPTQQGDDFVLTANWQFFSRTFTVPSDLGLTLSATGDDAFYAQIALPVGQTFDINFAIPTLNIGTSPLSEDFSTYDMTDRIIFSPRTGDVRTTFNAFGGAIGQNFGWVPANDGTIGNTSSGATSRANVDTWPLYNLIWNGILRQWCPLSASSAGTAYSDFIAGTTITLPRILGRVLGGENPATTSIQTFSTDYTSSSFILTVASTAGFITGTPVQFVGSNLNLLNANQVYYVCSTDFTSTTLTVSLTLDLAYAGSATAFESNSMNASGTIQTALGAYVGESTHIMTTAELVAHTHTFTTADPYIEATSVVGDINLTSGGGSLYSSLHPSGTTGSTGSTAPSNQLQPTTFANVMIKL